MKARNQRVPGVVLLILSHVFGPVSLLLWLAFLVRGPLNIIDMKVGETASLCINACLSEERDLVALFGQAYRDYQRRAPMLVPKSIRPIDINPGREMVDRTAGIQGTGRA